MTNELRVFFGARKASLKKDVEGQKDGTMGQSTGFSCIWTV